MNVSTLSFTDLPEIVSVLSDAFYDYPVMRHVLGARDGYDARLLRLVELFAGGRAHRGEPMLGLRDSAGHLMAAAVMTSPRAPDPPPRLPRLGALMAATLGVASMAACSRSASRAGVIPDLASETAQTGGDAAPGSALRPGLRLIYTSGGTEQAPWTVDSVTQNVVVGARQGCTRIVLRTRPDQAAPEVRLLCRGGDTLFAWNVAATELRVQRPVGSGMTVVLPQANGGTVRYETGERGRSDVSGRSIGFVLTTVTTHDPTGRAVRRLRERYALALATALDGVFEVRDTTAAGGWRETQRFSLTRVE